MGKVPRQNVAKTDTGSHRIGELVLSAMKKLTKNTGWTARTIVKFIKMEYNVKDPASSRKICRALRRGVRLGLLQMDHGRFRLNIMSDLVSSIESKTNLSKAPNRQWEPRDRPLRIRSQSPKSKKKAVKN